ncbi:MAG: reprolysin-like metallopeptidase, partial [Tepidisphaeraceae bacterium]
VRLDYTYQGFHAQVLSPTGAYYIDPYWHLDTKAYISYYKHDYYKAGGFKDLTPPGPEPELNSTEELETTSGTELRTYRVAVSALGEYTGFHGGTVPLGLSAVTTSINRITGVYEVDFAVRMTLIAAESSLIFTNPATDPFTSPSSASTTNTQNQTYLDANIGNANYDFGHEYYLGSDNGLAGGIGTVGVTGQKGKGYSSHSSPVGDPFDIDYVAHEMGHQFGGRHTFNNCNLSQGDSSALAVEPGSGNTIMSYAGICGSTNLQAHSDAYFHSLNYDQIIAYTTSGGGGYASAAKTATGNTPPTISAGSNYTIPDQTPFLLTASGSDANGDTLTYTWEQRNGGAVVAVGTDNGVGPLMRSWSPTTDPTRTLPRLSNLLTNTVPFGEGYPTTTRTINWTVMVRDNRAEGGGANTANMVVSTVNSGTGFAVTAPNTNVTWNAGTTQTVSWNVSGSTANGINTANVKISLSTDGGNTFPTVILASTSNDGTESITVPNVNSTTCRIKVEAVGNIYFDLSNTNFRIQPQSPATGQPDMVAASDTGSSASDNITNRNNSSAGTTLSFDIPNTVSGASVNLLFDGAVVASGVGNGGTLTLASDGVTTLSNNSHNVTARQTVTGQSQSPDSVILGITVDTVAPSISGTPVFAFSPSQKLTFVSNEDMGGVTTSNLSLTNLTDASTVSSGNMAVGTPNSTTAEFTFPGLSGAKLPDGSWRGVLNATDVAGNTMNANQFNFLYAGPNSPVTFFVRRNGANVELFKNASPPGSPTHQAAFATLSQIALDGGTDTDTVTIDYINGDMIPAGPLGFRYIGGAGGDTFNVQNSGIFTFSSDPAADTADMLLNVTLGATVNLSTAVSHLGGVTVNNATVALPTNGNRVVIAKALSLSGAGGVDLFDNDLILDYSGAPQIAAVQALIDSARNFGAWDGDGLTSTAARNDPNGITTLGAMEASEYENYYGGPTPFAGQTLDSTMVLVKYTYYGDTDFNGTINLDDYANVDGGYLLNATGWLNGDFDSSGGKPDLDDYSLIDGAFLTQSGVL